MKTRSLLPMALVTLALGAFILFYEKDLPSTDERRELETKVLRVDTEDVDAVTIQWPNDAETGELLTVRLRREFDTERSAERSAWHLMPHPMDSPAGASKDTLRRADAEAVGGLLDSLVALRHTRVFDTVDPSAAGLEPPVAQVTLSAGDHEWTLRFGNPLPASSDRTLTVDTVSNDGAGTTATYAVPGSVVDTLRRDPQAWRDAKLFHHSRVDIERLTLGQAGRPASQWPVLERRGEGDQGFWIESPIQDQADPSLVDALLGSLGTLEARQFLDASPFDDTGLGLAPPQATLEVLVAGRQEPWRLAVGAPVGSPAMGVAVEDTDAEDTAVLYARADGQLVTVDRDILEPLLRDAPAWRSRSWASTQVFAIQSARVTDAQGSFEIVREGTEWLRDGAAIDYGVASDFLYALTDLRAEQALDPASDPLDGDRSAYDPAQYDFEHPDLHIALAHDSGLDHDSGSESLWLYAPRTAAPHIGTVEGRDAVLLLPDVGALLGALEALGSAEPLGDESTPEHVP